MYVMKTSLADLKYTYKGSLLVLYPFSEKLGVRLRKS